MISLAQVQKLCPTVDGCTRNRCRRHMRGHALRGTRRLHHPVRETNKLIHRRIQVLPRHYCVDVWCGRFAQVDDEVAIWWTSPLTQTGPFHRQSDFFLRPAPRLRRRPIGDGPNALMPFPPGTDPSSAYQISQSAFVGVVHALLRVPRPGPGDGPHTSYDMADNQHADRRDCDVPAGTDPTVSQHRNGCTSWRPNRSGYLFPYL